MCRGMIWVFNRIGVGPAMNNLASRPLAVLFDMDGTLVSTEEEGFRIMGEVLRDFGFEMGHDFYDLFCGRSELDFLAEVGRRLQVADMDPVREAFYERYFPYLATVEPLPGAVGCLSRFAAEFPVAIVSGSTRAQIQAIVQGLGVAGQIGVRIGCDDLETPGKPHPGGYLQAARSLGVSPEHCLVVEDSRPGVEAGLAAGMRVAGVRLGTAGTQNLAGAHLVLDTLDELTVALARALFSEL